jgi:peptidyl-prolyl cis-trans isomerase C
MLHRPSVLLGAVAGVCAALIGVGFFGCQKKADGDAAKARGGDQASGLPAQSSEELGVPLARVDDVVITVGEFQERINRQSPYIRARYTSLEQKKEFLDNLIRFEVLAKEAFARDFDKDPDVVRTMKQVMIQKLMKDEFEDKLNPEDITDEEMRAFYKEHESEYNKPAEVRVSAIILRNKGQADKVAKEAHGEAGASNKGFRELVTRYSADETTKIRGGDLRYFSEQSTEIPKPVIDAAFRLERTGDVAGPIDAGNGTFYIIKQTGKRRALQKSFDEVKRQIQNRIYRDKRTTAQRDFIAGLRQKANVEVYEDNLGKVRVDTSASGAHHGHGHGDMPAFPGEGGDGDGHGH